jgi:uncharacterized protein (DUF2345 family)
MSEHVNLYKKLVEQLPIEAVDPKKGMSKAQLEETIKNTSKNVVRKAKHISCAKKAQKLVRSIANTARKHMAQISGRWFISM